MMEKRLNCVRYLGSNPFDVECRRYIRSRKRKLGTFLNLGKLYKRSRPFGSGLSDKERELPLDKFVEVGDIEF